MKKLLSFVGLILLFGGCTSQPNIKQDTKKDKQKISIQTSEKFERTISYQDIIIKINDINTKKKNNQRTKEIIKEYQYNVSDDDSKNSAREKALNQVKVIILEEIGVFVESYLELNKMATDEKYHKQFKQEIKNLTAGIIKTKILDEKYNGKQYYVKASVLVDPDSVSEGISEILKIKANQSEIKKLNALLESKENEIDIRSQETISLQKKITSQEFLNIAKEKELNSIKLKLQEAQKLLEKYQKDESALNKELSEVDKKVADALRRIGQETEQKTHKACSIKEGLTVNDIENIIGKATYCKTVLYGISKYCHQGGLEVMYYGKVKLYINDFNQVYDIDGC